MKIAQDGKIEEGRITQHEFVIPNKNLKNMFPILQKSYRALTHKANFKELEPTKTDCCITLCPLLSLKTRLKSSELAAGRQH